MRALAPAAALFLLCGQASANGPEIAQLAPERTFMVISVPDWPQLYSAVEKSGLGRLWKEPVITSLFEQVSKDGMKQVTEVLNRMQIDLEDVKHPTGHLGAALFYPDAGGEEDEDEPHFLFVAEFGEHADEWEKMIDKMVDRGLDDRIITLDDDRYRDVKITIIKPVYDEEHHRGNWHDHEHDHGFDLAEWIGGSFDDQRHLHLSRVGGTMIFTSSMKAIESAIDRMNGEARGALSESAVYRDAVAQHDRGAMAQIVFLTSSIFEDMDDDNSFGPSEKFIMDALGLSDVRAVSASVRVDTASALLDVGFSALASEKRGILNLVDEPAGTFEPPAFVSPDTTTVVRGTFRFDKVLDVARSIVQSLPENERQEVSMFLEQASGIAGPALDALGPIYHMTTSYRQPYSAESAQTTWIIDVSDEIAINNTLAFLSGQAGGMLETRDFEGTVIYSLEFPMELSFAVGLGRLFVGSTSGVESGLRAAARADAPRISEESHFRAATRPLSTNAVMYSYVNLGQYLRWTWWSIENADKIMSEQLDRIGLDGEYRDEMLRWHRENRPEWQKNLPPVDVITRHLGDMVYEMRSTADGYAGRMMLLKPREE